MNDYRISLAYMTSAEVRRVGQELRSDPSDTQPGWYVRAYRNEGYDDIVKLTRVSPERAALIAKAIDEAIVREPTLVGPVARAVEAGNVDHRRERVRRRELAEQAIKDAQATLAALRAEER